MVNVTSAARPCFLSAAKRASMRVVLIATRRRDFPRRKTTSAPCPSSSRRPLFQMPRYALKVLVAAAGEVNHHQVILGFVRRQVQHPGDGVRRLERRDDAFEPGEELKRAERFIIGCRQESD